MGVKEFFKPSMFKIVLTFTFAAFSWLFAFKGQYNLLIFSSWITFVLGPFLRIVRFLDFPEFLGLIIFFFMIIVSPYIQSCFLDYKKESIKSFLKPTKWKIIIFILFLILSSVPYIGALPKKTEWNGAVPHIVLSNELVRPINDTFDDPYKKYNYNFSTYTAYTFNPIFWLPYWYSGIVFGNGWKTPYELSSKNLPIIQVFTGDILTNKLRFGFIGILLYWYLLSCLIVSLYWKWKNRK